MLQITIPATELYDEPNGVFVKSKEQTLQLEHSLVSLSKWESKWCKPFLYTRNKTTEETLDYIKCMTITQNVKPETYLCLTKDNVDQIEKYIQAPMTATYFSESKEGKTNNEIVTAELIFYWMITLNIPVEFQKWHLNRLMALIKTCQIKNQPPKKKNTSDAIVDMATLNAQRLKKLNTKG